MRVLVTGGCGFIGSHLVDALMARGYAVAVLDNLSSGSMDNLKNRTNKPAFRFIQGDIRDAKAIEKAVVGVDAVIHEAAMINVPLSIEDPELTHSVNVKGTLNLLKASLKQGVKRFVYACYDSRTRAYTKDGLKNYDQLKAGDLVLSINPKTEEIEWKPVLDVKTYWHEGQMIHFKGRNHDLLVTPSHKMLIRYPGHGGRWPLSFEEAKKTAMRSTFKFPRGLWRGIKPRDVWHFELPPTRDEGTEESVKKFFYFIGLYIGDGYTCPIARQKVKTGLERDAWLREARDRKGRFTSLEENPVTVVRNHPRSFLAIPSTDNAAGEAEEALESLGLAWTRSSSDVIRFHPREFLPILLECGRGSHEKKIPEHFLNVSPPYLYELLRGLLDSDGDGKRMYRTTSPKLTHQMVELAAKLGLSITLRRYESKEVRFPNGHLAKPGSFYDIGIGWADKWAGHQYCAPVVEGYRGIVWCPVVADNHNLLVERNGKFVFSGNSSCSVYGDQADLPIHEDAPLKPLSPYASSKLAAEQNCRTFYELKELETVCLRYFNVYGPRQTSGEYAGVMIKFLERLRANQPPIIYGDGEQTRDFIHVGDVVDATLLALEREGAVGEVINIGTGKETNINELCELFLGLAGKTHLKPVHEARQAGDIKRSQADISKARKLLGFEPKVRLEDGVQRLLESIEGLEKS